jgi:hypothetical protein
VEKAMIRIFAVYCASLVAMLAYANYQGYVLNNFFDGQSHANKSANHYHK